MISSAVTGAPECLFHLSSLDYVVLLIYIQKNVPIFMVTEYLLIACCHRVFWLYRSITNHYIHSAQAREMSPRKNTPICIIPLLLPNI